LPPAAVWVFNVKDSRLLAAALLTTAICALHFTAMGAATVEYDPTVIARYPQIDNTLLATAIAGVTLLVILSGLTAALINNDTASELRHRADHDHLTGLPNKGYISRMIDNSIKSGTRSSFALFFIDLDRFKLVNDGYGHVVGDHVLRQAAQRLRHAVRETPAMAKKLADTIVSSFEQPFELPGGGGEALGVSVGVAIYPRDGNDGETLLSAADRALYRVKRTGGGAALAA
jgi:GGDEF domain-containing protein